MIFMAGNCSIPGAYGYVDENYKDPRSPKTIKRIGFHQRPFFK